MNIDNGTICLAPWVHLFISPEGRVRPCCHTFAGDFVYEPGDFFEYNLSKCFSNKGGENESINDVINSSDFNNLRLNMLKGIRSDICSTCYESEEKTGDSYRMTFNKLFSSQAYKVNYTNKDGSIKKFEPVSFDLRLSNSCNFKCRMCGPYFSSSWEKEIESKKDKNFSVTSRDINKTLKELEYFIDNVEQIYFAGGEPLIMDSHYKIIKILSEKKKISKVKFSYNTNLSTLKYKDISITDVWKNIPNLYVFVSIDGYKERGELIRNGLKWNKFIENVYKVKTEVPHAKIFFSCTLQALNSLHVFDLHEELYRLKLINSLEDFEVQFLYKPDHLSLKILPEKIKTKVKTKINDHIKNLLVPNKCSRNYIERWFRINDFFNEDKTHLIPDFIKYTNSLDFFRGENTKETFPELSELWE